jgi:hypothetical protein
MILSPKETVIAYRCPDCGSGIMSVVGAFALSGDLIKLKCSCGKSELHISRTSDKKLRITVPCLVCPKPHNYVIGQNTFFSREGVFTLSCTVSGLPLCFIGTKEGVSESLEEATRELNELLKDAGLDTLDEIREKSETSDPFDASIDDIIRYTICELEDEGKIKCKCPTTAVANYSLRYLTILCASTVKSAARLLLCRCTIWRWRRIFSFAKVLS